MIKKTGTWIAIVFIILALTSIYLFVRNSKTNLYPEEIIYNVSDLFKPELKLYLGNVESTIEKLKVDVTQVNVDELPVDSLNHYFSVLAGNSDLLYGIVLFGQNINYVIFRDQDSYIYTYNNLQDSMVNWQRIDNKLHPVPNGNWTDTYNNFMSESNFGSIKIAQLQDGEYVWRAAKSTLPDRQDILFNVFQIGTGDDADITALVYRTSEIGSRFSRALMYDNPLISIVTEDESIVSPIRTTDTAKITSFRKLETVVGKNYQLWKNSFKKLPHTFSFDEFKKRYFSRFDTIVPLLGVNGFVITISEEDFYNSKKKIDEVFLYVALLLLLFALFIYLKTFNKFKKHNKKSEKSLKPISNEEITTLITNGETEHVEFKSSLRWDYREEKVNKYLEDVIMKSISAFANAKGGILLIGVNDNMDIIGLQPDFDTLKKQDADYFELHLRKLINNQFGIKFANRHLYIHLPKINGKIICVIRVIPGNKALFLKTKDKQGQFVEKFYVRSGNASQEIASLSELNEYIKERFDLQN